MTEHAAPQFDPEIHSYYQRAPEESRLQHGVSQLEALRTRSIIERFAPAAPATVLDVGGGAGAYALWLAQAGYDVHLVDATLRLVAEARRLSALQTQPLASCEVGDARTLAFPSASADIVLLLGPLYHLTAANDRVRALEEAARVLKPGGVLFAGAISRWASAFDGLARDLYALPAFTGMVERAVRDGQHRNLAGEVITFTTAYFHRPEELAAEISVSGFSLQGVFGLEGPAGLLSDFDERWADSRKRADLIRVAETIEQEPALLGLSPHLLAVAHR